MRQKRSLIHADRLSLHQLWSHIKSRIAVDGLAHDDEGVYSDLPPNVELPHSDVGALHQDAPPYTKTHIISSIIIVLPLYTSCISAGFAVVLCPSVCPSVTSENAVSNPYC